MADSSQDHPKEHPGRDRVSRPMAAVRALGAFALFAALLVISLSVVGRHLDLMLPGSVEIVEVLFVVVAACAMVFATVDRAHAATRLFLDRLSTGPKTIVIKAGTLFGAIVWLAVTIGNAWLLYDVWGLHEVSPLLGIPIIPFRIVLILATASMSVVLFWQSFKGAVNA